MSTTLTYWGATRPLGITRPYGATRPWPDEAWLDDEWEDPDEEELFVLAEQIVLDARLTEEYDDDVVKFFRTLAIVLVVGLAAWLVVGVVALQLSGTLTGG